MLSSLLLSRIKPGTLRKYFETLPAFKTVVIAKCMRQWASFRAVKWHLLWQLACGGLCMAKTKDKA